MDMQERADVILKMCRQLVEEQWRDHAGALREPVVVLSEFGDPDAPASVPLDVALAIEEQADAVARLAEFSGSAAAALLGEDQTPFLMTILIAQRQGLTIRHLPCP